MIEKLVIIFDLGTPETRVASTGGCLSRSSEEDGSNISGGCCRPGRDAVGVRITVLQKRLVSLLHLGNEGELTACWIGDRAKLGRKRELACVKEARQGNENKGRSGIKGTWNH